MAGSIFPPWMIERNRWRREMEALSPVSGEDDSTTEGEEEEGGDEGGDEEGDEEGRCQKRLEEAKALIREQNDEISVLQGQVDQLQALAGQVQAQAARFRAEAVRNGREAFYRQVTIGAREQELLALGAALERVRRNCHCRGPGPRIRRRRCRPAAQAAVRAPPAPMQRRIGRIAKEGVKRPYPK